MKIKPELAVLVSIVIVVAGVLGSWALDWWQTESDKIPQRLDIAPGEDAQTAAYDPADIRGSYTLGEISKLFGIPLDELAGAFIVSPDKAEGFKVKELEGIFTDKASEVGTSSLRLFVAWYKGLPFERKEESFLPEPAAAILRDKAELSPEQAAYLDSHTYRLP